MEDSFQIDKSKSQTSVLTIKELYFKYIRFLPLFALTIALSLFAAYTYLRYSTPIYQSTGSLIIREDKKSSGDKLDQLMSAGAEVNIQNEIEQLKSRPIMERVVSNLNLNISYYAKGKIKESNNYKLAPFNVDIVQLADSIPFSFVIKFLDAYSFKVDDNTNRISLGQVFKHGNHLLRLNKLMGIVSGEYIIRWDNTSTVASGLSSSLLVVPKGATKILMLSLQAENPMLAADVINRLMLEYRLSSVAEKSETINQQLDFINDRIKIVDRELDSITKNLLAYQRSNNLIDFESQSANYFQRIQESDKALTEQQAQSEIVQMIENYLRNSKNDFNTTPSTLGIIDPTLSNLIGAYNVAQLERKELLDNKIPRSNPLVNSKEEQIEKLRQNILENLKNIKSTYAVSIQDIRKENNVAQSQVRLLPEKQQHLIEIKRQQETKLSVYNILLAERERSSITLAATTPNVRIIEEANANPNPVKPNKRNVQVIAVFIGLLIPALFILILELMNDKINSRSDIERVTDATILGEVGHSFGMDALVVTSHSRSVIAEQFRIIRSNLQYIIANIQNPVILITSSFSGEGKSFIATNIGAVMALAGKRTIILEFDIRKPKIMSHLQMPKKPGLTNYLLGKISLSDLAVPVPEQENLFVLPCGPVPPNPSELLLDERLDELFAYLKANFDIIIMDTAPVGMVSDALTLSKFSNATFFIIRQGYTFKKQLQQINEYYHQGKLPKLSLILNDVKVNRGYGYYGYGNYGYGSGYFDDEESQKETVINTWLGWMGLNGKAKKKKHKKHNI